jgi:hypothetical protein
MHRLSKLKLNPRKKHILSNIWHKYHLIYKIQLSMLFNNNQLKHFEHLILIQDHN